MKLDGAQNAIVSNPEQVDFVHGSPLFTVGGATQVGVESDVVVGIVVVLIAQFPLENGT